MIIEAHILCYNEERMIRHTLNHYSQFCDKIFLHDNNSTDRSLEIAAEYSKVEVKPFKSNKIDQRVFLEIKNNCWKRSRADWVIVCDMDELLYSENIVQDLQDLKQRQITLPYITGYNMYSEEFPDDYSKPITDQVQLGVLALNFSKQIIFDPHAIREIKYTPGAHNCNPTGRLLRAYNPNFKLLHYKYLSVDYLAERHHVYADRRSDYDQKKNFASEYQQGHKFLEEAFELLRKADKKNVIRNGK